MSQSLEMMKSAITTVLTKNKKNKINTKEMNKDEAKTSVQTHVDLHVHLNDTCIMLNYI